MGEIQGVKKYKYILNFDSQVIKIIWEFFAYPDANIMWGISVDETMGDNIRVTVIATNFEHEQEEQNTTVTTAAQQNFFLQKGRQIFELGTQRANTARISVPKQDFRWDDIPPWVRHNDKVD